MESNWNLSNKNNHFQKTSFSQNKNKNFECENSTDLESNIEKTSIFENSCFDYSNQNNNFSFDNPEILKFNQNQNKNYQENTDYSIIKNLNKKFEFHNDQWQNGRIINSNEKIKQKIMRIKKIQNQMKKLDRPEKLIKNAETTLSKLDEMIQKVSKRPKKTQKNATAQKILEEEEAISKNLTRKTAKKPIINLKSLKINYQKSKYTHQVLYNDIKFAKFSTQPAPEILCSFPKNKIRYVSDFTIENEFGKIEFLEPVDLQSVDLLRTVRIELGRIEVYPKELFASDREKPRRFRKLNQPARLVFKQVDRPRDFSNFEEFLREKSRQIGAVFERYDDENRELSVIVPGF